MGNSAQKQELIKESNVIYSEKFDSKKSQLKKSALNENILQSKIFLQCEKEVMTRIEILEEKMKRLEELSHNHKEDTNNNDKSIVTIIQKITEQEAKEEEKSQKKSKWLDKL